MYNFFMTDDHIEFNFYDIIDKGSHLITDATDCEFRQPFLDLQAFCDYPKASDEFIYFWYETSKCDIKTVIKNLGVQSISYAGIAVDLIRCISYNPLDAKDSETTWYNIGSDIGSIIRLSVGFEG